MRFIIITIMCLCLTGCLDLFFATPVDMSNAEWEEMGTVCFSPNAYDNLIIHFDPDGKACVAFKSFDSQPYISVYKEKNSGWEKHGDNFYSATGLLNFLSFALDSDGNPFVGYTDNGNLNVRTWLNGTWNLAYPEVPATNAVLTLDPDGDLLIAYINETAAVLVRSNAGTSDLTSIYSNISLTSGYLSTISVFMRTNNDNTYLLHAYDPSSGHVFVDINTESTNDLGANNTMDSPAESAYNPDNDKIYLISDSSISGWEFDIANLTATTLDLASVTPLDAASLRIDWNPVDRKIYYSYLKNDNKTINFYRFHNSSWIEAGIFQLSTEINSNDNYIMKMHPKTGKIWVVLYTETSSGENELRVFRQR